MTTHWMLLGLTLPLGAAAWWAARRRPSRARPTVLPSPAPDVPAAPSVSTERTPSPAAATDVRTLMHRLYAAAFDDAALDGDIPGGHLAVAVGAEAVLARIEEQPKYTPRRPQLLPQLMRALNDPQTSLEAIARIIGQDPTLSGNLLRIANSPLYRVSLTPVESLERAVTRLGIDGLRPVIAAALVQPVMRTGDGAFGRLPALIWDHTLLAAAAASEHARAVEHDDAFAAQLLGLLHGLGAILVVQVLRDEYATRPDLAPDPNVVATLLDGWSAQTARRIADSWNLSDRFGEALTAQHVSAVPGDPLGRALRVGLAAGALVMLHRLGRIDDEAALTLLAGVDAGRDGDPARLWQRLHAQRP